MSDFPVSRELSCRTCSYQLRGLSALGRCPECGAEIMTSVVIAVDPELRDFATLRAPRRVAATVLLSTVCLALAVLVQFAGPGAALLQELRDQAGLQPARYVALGWWFAAGLLAIGALASIGIAPKSEPLLRAEWGRRRHALGLGLLLWAVAIVALPLAFGWRPSARMPGPFVLIITTAWQLLASLAPLAGLRSLLSILGRRSRRWREARQGRQSVDSLLAAGAGVLVFSTAVPIMASFGFESFHMLALLLAVACAAVLSLGLLYMVMNSWWISRSLIRPAALMSDYVEGARSTSPVDTSPPSATP